jgi:hypothetical protein
VIVEAPPVLRRRDLLRRLRVLPHVELPRDLVLVGVGRLLELQEVVHLQVFLLHFRVLRVEDAELERLSRRACSSARRLRPGGGEVDVDGDVPVEVGAGERAQLPLAVVALDIREALRPAALARDPQQLQRQPALERDERSSGSWKAAKPRSCRISTSPSVGSPSGARRAAPRSTSRWCRTAR